METSFSTAVAATHSAELFSRAVAQATELLKSGQVVALPTETVYGLAANALDACAVERIYAVKGRPAHNPIIVHVASMEMARAAVASWTDLADHLARAFWPGPLTLVLPSAANIPDIVVAGGTTVGIRWPAHPLMQAVIRACGFPLAAPSANLSNRTSPTTAAHVARDLGSRIPLIVDGGACQVGIESTVLDLSVDPPRILRPGMIHENAIRAVTGTLSGSLQTSPAAELKSPGLLQKHYSPRAKLVCWHWQNQQALDQQSRTSGVPQSRTHVLAHTHIPSQGGFGRVAVIPHDPEAFARALYAELHQCDHLGAELIVVEQLPEGPAWTGIADRLRRAAS